MKEFFVKVLKNYVIEIRNSRNKEMTPLTPEITEFHPHKINW